MAVLGQGTAALGWFEPSPSGGSGWGPTWRGDLLGDHPSGFSGLLVTGGRHWLGREWLQRPPDWERSWGGAAGGRARAGCAVGLCAVVKEAEVLDDKALGPGCRREPGSDPSSGVRGKGEAGSRERRPLASGDLALRPALAGDSLPRPEAPGPTSPSPSPCSQGGSPAPAAASSWCPRT